MKENKKKELFEFYSEIYPRRIWCYFGNNAEFIADTFNPMSADATKEAEIKELEEHFNSDSTGWTTRCWRTSDNALGILVVVSTENRTEIEIIRTIAHEAVHVTDAICEDLDIVTQSYTDTNEPYAYLLEWVVGNIYESYKEYICK